MGLALLLDTCTFLWLAAEPTRLSPAARAAIDADDAELFLSDVSILETSLKWSAGKIVLPAPPRAWFAAQITAWHVARVALEQDDIFRTTELPPFHKDPFDRLLVAQAIGRRASVVTADPAIRAYPVSVIW